MHYIREYFGVLYPGRILVFHVPNEQIIIHRGRRLNREGLILCLVPKQILDATYRKIRYGYKPVIEVYTIRKTGSCSSKSLIALGSNPWLKFLAPSFLIVDIL